MDKENKSDDLIIDIQKDIETITRLSINQDDMEDWEKSLHKMLDNDNSLTRLEYLISKIECLNEKISQDIFLINEDISERLDDIHRISKVLIKHINSDISEKNKSKDAIYSARYILDDLNSKEGIKSLSDLTGLPEGTISSALDNIFK